MAQSLTEMVSGGKKVQFVRYVRGDLWYSTEDGFEFPVPVADTGDGVFLVEDKAILFMRYIRKHLSLLNAARVAESA